MSRRWDIREDPPDHAAIVASVDGMAGPEAWAVLGPIGWWPPTLEPLLVKEVVIEPGLNEFERMSIRFVLA